MSKKEVEDPVINQHRQDRFLRWRGFVRFLLIVEIVVLACFAYWDSLDSASVPLEIAEQTVREPIQVIARSATHAAVELAFLGVLAVLTGAAFAPGILASAWIRFPVAWVFASVFAFCMAMMFIVVKQGLPVVVPSFITVLVLGMASLCGCWLGITWMRANSTLKWFFFQLLFMSVVFIGGAYSLSQLAFSNQPLAMTKLKADSEVRRHLVELFKNHDPRDLQEDETGQLSLTETELNQLLGWGLSAVPGEHQGNLALNAEALELNLSFRLPKNQFISPHLNVIAAGEVTADQNKLGFRPLNLSLGKLSLPEEFLNLCGPILVEKEWNSPTVDRFLQSLNDVKIEKNLVTLNYSHLDVNRDTFREAMLEIGLFEDLSPAITVYVNALAEQADENTKVTFENCFEAVFSEAEKRSSTGDPVKENRAAILALGYALGHHKLHLLLGEDVPKFSGDQLKKFRKVTLRGRQDWTQHFSVSAALQVLANSAISMDVGILKEELDADGGSGFSFGDLLADRSGTMFASQATGSHEKAVDFQKRINSDFSEADYIPPGNDLPEGLSDEEFQSKFGGVGGDGYRKLLEKIDSRIQECAAYRTEE